MDNPHETWIQYWEKDDFWKDSTLWKINADLFLRRADKIVGFRKSDAVLNIGCGPGYLEPLLAPRVKQLDSVDTAQQFVRLCGKNCSNHPNVTVALLGHDYTDLTFLSRSYSLILCISVVQYYRDITEVEALITSARSVALPGARMLIADLPLKRRFIGFTWDSLCSCLLSLREGYTKHLLCTVLTRSVQRSLYQSFRSRTNELHFDIPLLESLIRRMGLKANIVRKNLSVYANRPSLLIQL